MELSDLGSFFLHTNFVSVDASQSIACKLIPILPIFFVLKMLAANITSAVYTEQKKKVYSFLIINLDCAFYWQS